MLVLVDVSVKQVCVTWCWLRDGLSCCAFTCVVGQMFLILFGALLLKDVSVS